jgi:hypothetical protein
MAGFEPTVFCFQSRRFKPLSYIPHSVPATGLEPILQRELDFKSSASTIPPSRLFSVKAIELIYVKNYRHAQSWN